MVQQEPDRRDALLELVRAGEWLNPGSVAVVLGVHRNTVANMLDRGQMAWKPHAGGRNRLVSPDSVLEQLANSERVRTGPALEPLRAGGRQAEVLTANEVAALLGAPESEIRRWEESGWLVPLASLGDSPRRYSDRAVAEFRRRRDAGDFA